MLEGIKRFQEFLLELGVARGVISLPAPRMLALGSPTGEGAESANIYTQIVVEPEIVAVSRDLFVSGHYSHAVQEAYKAVEKYVAEKSARSDLSGTTLMELAFSPKAPVLFWTEQASQSEKDEQAGYHRIYAGAMLGIRNPVIHEFNWVQEPDVALELLALAQHLLRKAKLSIVAGKK
jgi:uncharacterized protein (TIGR02391 family)